MLRSNAVTPASSQRFGTSVIVSGTECRTRFQSLRMDPSRSTGHPYEQPNQFSSICTLTSGGCKSFAQFTSPHMAHASSHWKRVDASSIFFQSAQPRLLRDILVLVPDGQRANGLGLRPVPHTHAIGPMTCAEAMLYFAESSGYLFCRNATGFVNCLRR